MVALCGEGSRAGLIRVWRGVATEKTGRRFPRALQRRPGAARAARCGDGPTAGVRQARGVAGDTLWPGEVLPSMGGQCRWPADLTAQTTQAERRKTGAMPRQTPEFMARHRADADRRCAGRCPASHRLPRARWCVYGCGDNGEHALSRAVADRCMRRRPSPVKMLTAYIWCVLQGGVRV